jgi:pimeloyl-ACP methyl ester carboxylesterase
VTRTLTPLAHRVDFPDAGGTPLVLIHGVGDRMAGWDGVVAALRGDRPVVRYDLRGHGDSPRTPGPYELGDFVADHVGLLAQLGIERAHVAGFSLGGMISQAVALARPETVDRLAIMGAVAGRTPAESARVLERLAVLEREGPAGMAQVSADRWYTPEFIARRPEVVERQLRELAANDPETYVASYRVLARNDLGDELHRIAAPTLVLTGDGDVGSPPRMSELMGERIPDSQVRILRGVKHGALVEVPELVARELDAFLGATGPGHDKEDH